MFQEYDRDYVFPFTLKNLKKGLNITFMIIFRNFFRWLVRRDSLHIRLGKTVLFAMLFNCFFGVIFYFAEKDIQTDLCLSDAIWWSMVTMTTVGYGDVYAQTFVGRFIVSYACMLVGIGIMGYVVATVAESMIEHLTKKKRGLLPIMESNHIIICHYPSLEKILQVVRELRAHKAYQKRQIVLICDTLEELPEALLAEKIRFVRGNPAKEEILQKANLNACEGVFVLAADANNPDCDTHTFAVGAIIEMIEREIQKPIKVIVELVSRTNLKMMQRAKTDGIVTQEGISDCLLVQEYLYPGVHLIFEQIMRNAVGSQFYIVPTRLSQITFGALLCAAAEYPKTIQIIGVMHDGKPMLNPEKTLSINADNALIVLAETVDVFRELEEKILTC